MQSQLEGQGMAQSRWVSWQTYWQECPLMGGAARLIDSMTNDDNDNGR